MTVEFKGTNILKNFKIWVALQLERSEEGSTDKWEQEKVELGQ